MDELVTAVRRLSEAFQALGLQPPASIELAHAEDGRKLLSIVPTQARHVLPDPDQRACKILDTVVRWPEE